MGVKLAYGPTDRVDELVAGRLHRGQGQDDGSWLRIDEAVHRALRGSAGGPQLLSDLEEAGLVDEYALFAIRALWEPACRSFGVAWT